MSTPRPTSGAASSAPAAGTLAATGEFAVIDAVVSGASQPATTLLGPGDDAAVVAVPDGRVVSTVDVLVDGVHFRTDWASGEQIGRRAALASLSDVNAMGAVSTALLVGLCAPPDTALELVTGIGRGLQAAAAAAGAGVVGGDLTRSSVLTISVTALGDLQGRDPVLRSGARAGDVVAVCGRLGWAGAGLAVLSRGFRSPAAVVDAYRVPDPPQTQGPAAPDAGATAMVDVSDGLLADLGHVAEASGVGIELDSAALPPAQKLLEVAAALGKDWRHWVLTGGDDHALAACFPADATLPPDWHVIGRVVPGGGVLVDGAVWDAPAGWDHFG
jgi:thiamine-monophosphate kinase